jgi:hypothetical protein
LSRTMVGPHGARPTTRAPEHGRGGARSVARKGRRREAEPTTPPLAGVPQAATPPVKKAVPVPSEPPAEPAWSLGIRITAKAPSAKPGPVTSTPVMATRFTGRMRTGAGAAIPAMVGKARPVQGHSPHPPAAVLAARLRRKALPPRAVGVRINPAWILRLNRAPGATSKASAPASRPTRHPVRDPTPPGPRVGGAETRSSNPELKPEKQIT